MSVKKIVIPNLVDVEAVTSVATLVSAGLTDAFGRIRTSGPYTVFATKQVNDDAGYASIVENFPELFDNAEVSGGGTATLFSVNNARTRLSVTATTAGERVRQSRRRINYQPGKSQRALLTGILYAGAAGITQRYGLFDDNNGLFFQVQDGVLAVVKRTYTSGAAVDLVTEQDDWNIDRMDGTGPSKITIDLDTSQIFYIDFEWLGVGSVRFGLVIDGMIYYVHQLDHANSIDTVYMSTPNLPVRMSIENDGTGPAYFVDMFCCSVDSEGGVDPQGKSRSFNNGAVDVTIASTLVSYPVLGIRLRSTHLGVQVDVTNISVMIPTVNDDLIWELQLNPTLSAGLTYGNILNSGVQGAVGNGVITVTAPGYVVSSGYAKTASEINLPTNIIEKLGSAIDGTPDELVLVCKPLSGSTDVFTSLSWRELI